MQLEGTTEFEKHMNLLHDVCAKGGNLSEETADLALDCMAFVRVLHQVFQENGFVLDEEPDVAKLENLVDALYGELGAAVLFLAADGLKGSEHMLRKIGPSMIESNQKSGDPNMAIPVPLIHGFARLADRVEASRNANNQIDPSKLDP